MKYTVTGSQMKEIDRYTIQEIGIPSMVLMERAALAVAEAAAGRLTAGARVMCVCGSGNNGADAVAAGRILTGWGYRARILLAEPAGHQTEELRCQLEIAGRLGIPVYQWEDRERCGSCQVVIDGLFGIGLTRTVQGRYRDAVQYINGLADISVIAVDIPSGIHSDTGAIMGCAVEADITVAFGYAKTGQRLYPGRRHCGELQVAEIGFPAAALTAAGGDALCYGPEDLALIPERPEYSNKGSYGKVLVVAGSAGMSGAAYFSAMAAYRMGAGIVKILTVEENRVILQEQIPEAIVETFTAELVTEHPEELSGLLAKQCRWATVIVLGPGLGSDPYVESIVAGILTQAYVPIVLDADGLNTVAGHPYLTGYFTDNIIVTPHLGEMARLSGMAVEALRGGILTAAREYAARYGITCVLKDAVTAVADKDGIGYLNTSGCSAMAKGGSGDVLTGIIAGLLALGLEEGEAARLGVYLHGRAGEQAAAARGSHGVTAGDLLTFMTWKTEADVQI